MKNAAMRDIREALTPAAREIYDRVETMLPAWEDSRSPFGTQARGSTRGDAFRSLMEYVERDGVPMPTRQRRRLRDGELIAAANDPELQRRAWAQLASDEPDGWKVQWLVENRADREGTYLIIAMLVVGAILAAVTSNNWFFAIAVVGLIVLLVVPKPWWRARAVRLALRDLRR